MRRVLWAVLALVAVAQVQAQPVFDPAAAVHDTADELRGAHGNVDGVLDLVDPPEESEPAPPPKDGGKDSDEGFAGGIARGFQDEIMMLGVGGGILAALGVGGLALVTRYVSPKEALKNPQRSMLYGFVRGNPGVHLKQLSEEFKMKTSSILWHIRKLEAAELVKSERANGYRVFYPVDGGVEIKRVSRALTALQNDNARRIFERIQRHSGSTTRQLSDALSMHGGTARWHLRKLRDHGLLEELVRDDGSRFYATPLGKRALETMEGRPVDAPRAVGAVDV